MATADSKWNVSIEKPALLHVDPRASVGTRYAPSEFTFNANWSPAPLVASSSSPFGLGQWSRLYTHNDDAERVSHLDFDDEDEDDNDEHGEWHGDEYSRPIRRPSDPFADSNAAYLASYGFTNGLGYERPPARSSSSSPSSYSDYNGDDNFNSNYNNNGGDGNSNSNSKFAANSNFLNDHMSSPNTRRSKIEIETEINPRRAELHPELPWPLSHKASNALLNSLALDAPLRDDPCGAWEALCWDEAAPEGDSDDEEEDGDGGEGKRKESDGRGMGEDKRRQQIGRGNIWRKDVGHAIAEEEEEGEDTEDRWRNFLSPPLSSAPSRPRSRSPAPYPTSRDDSTETDVRTISNETSNSTGTSSTITATTTATAAAAAAEEEEEDSEEWISLTAARAQAARARILPSRAFSSPSAAVPPVQVQVPFPTRTQADIAALVARLEGGGGRQARTPVDPVLTTPPPPPLPSSLHISAYQRDPEHENANASGERRGSEDSGGAETETETAPHYGESGRDRLLTLTERDPPPYDLEYGSQMGREEVSARMRGGDADEEMPQGRDVTIGLRASSSTPYLAHASIPHPHARSRSQLTFPTSPTDSLPTLTSRTSPTSASPTETLTTPAGTFFSALFPAPAAAAAPGLRSSAAEDSIHYAPGSSKERESRLGAGAGAGAGSPFSFSSPVERRMGSSVFAEPARAIPGAGAAARTTPRPLPARPRGARTTAGAWLSASAAGPYASGTRSVVSSLSTPSSSSGSGWGWGSPSSPSDFGPHCAIAFNNGNGNGNGNGEGEVLPPPSPLTMKVSTEVVVDEDGDMRAERNTFWKGRGEEEEEGRRSTVTLTPLRRGDFFPAPSSLSLPLPLSSSPSPSPSPPVQHHANSSLTESSKKSMESVKKEQRKDVKSRSKSNSESHVTSTVEAIGLGARSQKHRSRSSRPLQRLATLSRRIGIVAGVGGGR